MGEDPQRSAYMFNMKNGYYIDASDDACTCHAGMRPRGRLINHEEKTRANLCARFHLIMGVGHGNFIFVAKRDILPLDELYYDYGDNICAELFQ